MEQGSLFKQDVYSGVGTDSSRDFGCPIQNQEYGPETGLPETETVEPETPEPEMPKTELSETGAPKTELPETGTPETEIPESIWDIEAPSMPGEDEIPETETAEAGLPEDEIPDAETVREEKQALLKAAKTGLTITCDIDEVVNYALIHNGVHILREICIRNDTDLELKDLVVRVGSQEGIVENETLTMIGLQPGEKLRLKDPELKFNAAYFAPLTERSLCSITIEIFFEENQVAVKSVNLTALAFDEWPGLRYTPELLAAFSMPNHPVVTSLLQLAAKYLGKWTKDPSLAGYQYDDPERVNYMAAAAYAAIQQKNITYAEPPSSFEEGGQRIRLADAVLDQHFGTCMDMTLLYAACLEAMGLNPVLILMHGHIFAGVWLIDETFPDMITDDPSQLEKRMSRGIHEMTVVECTAMCAGRTRSFDEAVKAARQNVADYISFNFVIDVKRARSMGIRPLPVRVKTDSGFEVRHEDRSEKDVTGASKGSVEIFDLSETGQNGKMTKLSQWERKLLDLSLRNMLINMRMTKAVIPLLCADVGLLEDALSNGKEFRVLDRPQEMSIPGGSVTPEILGELGPFTEFIKLESSSGRLHSLYTQKELAGTLTKIYRSAKTSMEENGASTLYLVLGLLRWYEGKRGRTPRYAPVVLVPIDIQRKGAGKGYTLRMRDEGAQINITLCEFLKQNFDIQINGLDPPPADEQGLDIPRVFAIVRHAVMSLPGWDVVEAAFIGNFSFSQFVMWNDIHSNSTFLKKNKIVRSLINGTIEWDCRIPEDVDAQEAYLPINVDSSQLHAINMAAAGTSFVLHGPPGTGKSQTITAMIANALTRGKSVLFVAEKMAALEVVQKRLEALGIQDFCLELHSNKATKKAVLTQLTRSLKIGVWGLQTGYDVRIEDIRRLRAELDAYAKALHEQRPFGRSLRELIDRYEMIPDTGKILHFDRTFVAGLTERELDHHVYGLERLIAAGRGIGHPCDHPLRAVHKTQYSQSIRFDLDVILRTYMDALKDLQDRQAAFAGILHVERTITKREWNDLLYLARTIPAAEEVPGFLRNCTDLDQEFALPEAYLLKLQAFTNKKRQVLANWNENFLHMNMETYRARYDAASKKIFGRARAIAALTSEIQAYAFFPVSTERIPAYFTDITFYQKEEAELTAAWDAFSHEWKQILEKYPTPVELKKYKDEMKEKLGALSGISDQVKKLDDEGTLKTCIEYAGEFLSSMETADKAEEKAQELLDLSFEDDEENWIGKRLVICAGILEHAASLKDWIVYQQYAGACREMGLGKVCDAYEAGLPHDEVKDVYLRSIYQAMILSVIESEQVLNGFTGIEFNEKIAQFKKLDQDFMELTKEEMFYKLTHQLPTSYESPEITRELNILRRAAKSNGRGISIRSLFDQIPHILTRLCPCMLMSPISVAQYLAPKNDLFDIVIFDEASQLPTCKAVGVLARGRDVVIAGDPNQMPPTSFFAGNTIDEDNLDIEDLDSILDDCLALGMPSSYLQWHYRSRHESLIAFSNEEFYENSMLTFPSVNDRERKVSLKKVEGFFDRSKGRVNEGEARAIVAEIRRRYQDPTTSNQTIGVVTFNISQQLLIEDLLQEEYEKDLLFDKWANTGVETLFVKNLENVQGDERDVILFSIAFGPDAEGKVLLNFGPINKEGGWKRLNVAVSRARLEMVVFTTMTADMIDLRRTKSKGVEAMRDFLEYAQKGRLNGTRGSAGSHKKEGILEHVCQSLDAHGYKYQKAVGRSRFKVDIAVINPYNEDEFLLGILLDGDSYKEAGNTRDRELAQINVLNGLGWEIHRIWTMDWWDNRDREMEKLMRILEQKKEEAHQILRKKQEMQEKSRAEGREKSGMTDQEEALTADQEKPWMADPERVQAAGQEKPWMADPERVQAAGQEKPLTADQERDQAEDQEKSLKAGQEKSSAKGQAGFTEDTLEAEPQGLKTKTAVLTQEARTTPEPKAGAGLQYRIEEYTSALTNVTPLSGTEYAKRKNIRQIAGRMQEILNAEAPIAYERLVKKTLRSFHISRSSALTREATDQAFLMVSAKGGKQDGIIIYWRMDQEPENYEICRIDSTSSDRRSPDEICREEIKNAICVTLQEMGALDKDDLIRETVRIMGYARSGKALISAVERGLRYGCGTGEIVQDEKWRFTLPDA